MAVFIAGRGRDLIAAQAAFDATKIPLDRVFTVQFEGGKDDIMAMWGEPYWLQIGTLQNGMYVIRAPIAVDDNTSVWVHEVRSHTNQHTKAGYVNAFHLREVIP